MTTRRSILTCALAAAALLPACRSVELPVGTAEQRRNLAQLSYPADAPDAAPADVVVRREGATIRLINRTAAPTSPGVLWLNEQYAGYVEPLAIGPGNVMPLHAFVNKHGETFPTGTFLAPDKAAPVLSAELVANGQTAKQPLTVWPDDR